MITNTNNKGKLPPQRKFKLSYILSHSTNANNHLKQLNDNIINTVNLYNDDINEQLNSVIKVEDELIGKLENVEKIYDIVHDIRVNDINDNQIIKDDGKNNDNESDGKKVKKGLAFGSMFKIGNNNGNKPINKFQQYEQINNEIEQIVDNTIKNKKKLDCLINRLKKLEIKLTKRERLFDINSVNQYHYQKLFNYGMKDEIAKQDEKMEEIEKYVIENTSRIEGNNNNNNNHDNDHDNDVLSNSSHKSKISPIKLQQYLDIENEIEQMQKLKQENDSKNTNTKPILTLSSNKFGPGLKFQSNKKVNNSSFINYEPITVIANVDKIVDDIHVENDNVSPLIDELKKMYK